MCSSDLGLTTAGIAAVGGLPVAAPGYLQIAVGVALFYGILGASTGMVFALTLALAERRTSFATLRMSRVLLWGAASGAVYPTLFLALSRSPAQQLSRDTLVGFLVSIAFGMGSAALMLALARKARATATVALPDGAASQWEAEVVQRASERVNSQDDR